MIAQELNPVPDPVRCCELLSGLPYRMFMDSAVKGPLGRYSFLTADPVAVVRSKGTVTEHLDLLKGTRHDVPHDIPHTGSADALATVRALLAPFATAPAQGLPPFQGGAAGYLAYDWANQLERLPVPRYDDLAMPDVVLGIYDWVLAWDHEASRAWLISTGLPETSPAARDRRAAERAAAVRDLIVGGPERPALHTPVLARPTLQSAPVVARPFQGRE